jgi:hypothetical protein
MKIAFEAATELICAALPLAVTLGPALVPLVVLWSMSEHWNTRHGLTTVIAVSADRLPDGLRVRCGAPWGIVAPSGPDPSDTIDEE